MRARYILLLLVLVVYIFAVLGVEMFGANDPANFGNVTTAMLTLFQVSSAALDPRSMPW